MKPKNFFYPLVAIAIFALFSCQNAAPRQATTDPNAQLKHTKEQLIQIHEKLLAEQTDSIQNFIRSQNLEFEVSPSGLFYHFTKNGGTKKPLPHQTVSVNLRISYLDGTPVFSSDSLGAQSFKLNTNAATRGLEEALYQMAEGERAELILPPHLAFGSEGNGENIRPNSILRYYVELLKIEK